MAKTQKRKNAKTQKRKNAKTLGRRVKKYNKVGGRFSFPFFGKNESNDTTYPLKRRLNVIIFKKVDEVPNGEKIIFSKYGNGGKHRWAFFSRIDYNSPFELKIKNITYKPDGDKYIIRQVNYEVIIYLMEQLTDTDVSVNVFYMYIKDKVFKLSELKNINQNSSVSCTHDNLCNDLIQIDKLNRIFDFTNSETPVYFTENEKKQIIEIGDMSTLKEFIKDENNPAKKIGDMSTTKEFIKDENNPAKKIGDMSTLNEFIKDENNPAKIPNILLLKKMNSIPEYENVIFSQYNDFNTNFTFFERKDDKTFTFTQTNYMDNYTNTHYIKYKASGEKYIIRQVPYDIFKELPVLDSTVPESSISNDVYFLKDKVLIQLKNINSSNIDCLPKTNNCSIINIENYLDADIVGGKINDIEQKITKIEDIGALEAFIKNEN